MSSRGYNWPGRKEGEILLIEYILIIFALNTNNATYIPAIEPKFNKQECLAAVKRLAKTSKEYKGVCVKVIKE